MENIRRGPVDFRYHWPVSDSGGIFVDSIALQIDILESFLAEQYAGGRDKVMYRNALRVYSPDSAGLTLGL